VEAGVEGVADAVAGEVDAEDGQGDGEAGMVQARITSISQWRGDVVASAFDPALRDCPQNRMSSRQDLADPVAIATVRSECHEAMRCTRMAA
jgi:hypothetical protein